MTFCEYCQEEKTLHETVKFLGVKRPFCSEGHYSVLNFCRSLTVHCPVIKSTAVHIMTCCDFIFSVWGQCSSEFDVLNFTTFIHHDRSDISGSVFVRSAGCKLLFKQDFASRLGLKCVTCNHCTQMCKKSLTKQIDGVSRDFCSETCAKKFHDWYYKVHWSSCLIWSFITLGSCDQALVAVLLLHRSQRRQGTDILC